jgi:hypothetical protein
MGSAGVIEISVLVLGVRRMSIHSIRWDSLQKRQKSPFMRNSVSAMRAIRRTWCPEIGN